MKVLLLAAVLALVFNHPCASQGVSCIDDANDPVPFWFSHKWKGSHYATYEGEATGEGYDLKPAGDKLHYRNSWSYFDLNSETYRYHPQEHVEISECKAPGCMALRNTLANIVEAPAWFSFNDQPQSCAPTAHEKFFLSIAADGSAMILHMTVPNMLRPDTDDLPRGKDDKSAGGHRNGQSFLCLNIPADQTARILRLIYSIEPRFGNQKTTNNPDLIAVGGNSESAKTVELRTYFKGLSKLSQGDKSGGALLKASHLKAKILSIEPVTHSGVTFDLLFKRTNYGEGSEKGKVTENGDIWVLAQEKLNDLYQSGPIVVSTWEGTANTENVVDAQCVIPEARGGSYRQSGCRKPNYNDHSKLGYSKTVTLVMQSGNNRRATQHRRGGMMIAVKGEKIKPLWQGLQATHTEAACPTHCSPDEDHSEEEVEEDISACTNE